MSSPKFAVQKKPKFTFPHVYVVIFILMILMTILCYVIPSGNYTRIVDEATKQTVVSPGSFQWVEKTNPITLIDFFKSIYTGMVQGGIIISSLLICSAGLFVLESPGTLTAGIHMLLQRLKGKEFSGVVIFYTIFAIFGVLGFGEGAYPFYPLITVVIMAMGYDRMMGAGVAILGSTVGFMAGAVNMFTTGIAQQLVGLPLFSGIELRLIGFVLFYLIGIFYLYFYARRIKKDPQRSFTAQEYLSRKETEQQEEKTVPMTMHRKIALAAFLVLIFFQAYGPLVWKWGLPQICGLYVMLAIFLGFLFRISMTEISERMISGAQRVLGAALAIGLARSITVLLEQGNIIDTLVHYMTQLMDGKGVALTLFLILSFVLLFDFFLSSGSGKAVILMPLLSPLGNVLKINQQVLVLAYQYGDGIANSLWPSGAMISIALCNMNDYGAWVRFSWKFFALIFLAGYGIIMVAQYTNYGPF